MWTLVIGGYVFQTTTENPSGRFPPDMQWITCPNGTLQGWTASESGGMWTFSAPPAPPGPTPAQQCAALLSGTLTITSPTLGLTSAAFPVTADAAGTNVWTMVLSELAALTLNGGATFADGSTTVHWPDEGGTLHAFTPSEFQLFAKTLGAFVAQARNFGNGVSGASLPSASVTIA
jgi:hypothetical protein